MRRSTCRCPEIMLVGTHTKAWEYEMERHNVPDVLQVLCHLGLPGVVHQLTPVVQSGDCSRWLGQNYIRLLASVMEQLGLLLSKLTKPHTKQPESSAMALRALLMLWVVAADIPDLGACSTAGGGFRAVLEEIAWKLKTCAYWQVFLCQCAVHIMHLCLRALGVHRALRGDTDG